jgi:hypothetical protein
LVLAVAKIEELTEAIAIYQDIDLIEPVFGPHDLDGTEYDFKKIFRNFRAVLINEKSTRVREDCERQVFVYPAGRTA